MFFLNFQIVDFLFTKYREEKLCFFLIRCLSFSNSKVLSSFLYNKSVSPGAKITQLINIKTPLYQIKYDSPTNGAPIITIIALIGFVLIKFKAWVTRPTKIKEGLTIIKGYKINGELLICSRN